MALEAAKTENDDSKYKIGMRQDTLNQKIVKNCERPYVEVQKFE
jgi:hypothetical protein